MNYRRIYMLIVEHAKKEVDLGLRPKTKSFKKDFPNQYFEFHHILPKSLFPFWKNRKSNIIPLTAREHFFCHQLLEKIYPNSNMFIALWLLANDGQNNYCSSRQYQKLKERYKISETHYQHIKEASQKLWSSDKAEVVREKIKIARQKQTEEGRVAKDWHHTQESLIKISKISKDRMSDPEMRKLISQKVKDAFNSNPEIKEKCKKGGKIAGERAKKKAAMYKQYKADGGVLDWNSYQKSVNI